MAQILVRGIPDDVMKAFKARAKRRGVSAEQAVRELIEQAALDHKRQGNWYRDIQAFHERVAQEYGVMPSSVDSIREDRDSR